METKIRILRQAEHVFDEHGFAASGVDRVTDAAGVSTRTLYKHVGSKSALIEAVLSERQARFFASVNGSSLDELFDSLETWMVNEGARGCFFLRAEGENAGQISEITNAVDEYHRLLRDLIDRIVSNELHASDPMLSDQILILFEGATSAATYRGASVVRTASAAASALLQARILEMFDHSDDRKRS
ncbi:TetR/AcrR family transcriptional regulator [Microbacterium marmarense]|uniref:TetR/AcrR family transcriptional regulator n=1 Tax=Microbacterium marmarense TaxID=3122051 RepID=A0ABU8LVW1_9MICO